MLRHVKPMLSLWYLMCTLGMLRQKVQWRRQVLAVWWCAVPNDRWAKKTCSVRSFSRRTHGTSKGQERLCCGTPCEVCQVRWRLCSRCQVICSRSLDLTWAPRRGSPVQIRRHSFSPPGWYAEALYEPYPLCDQIRNTRNIRNKNTMCWQTNSCEQETQQEIMISRSYSYRLISSTCQPTESCHSRRITLGSQRNETAGHGTSKPCCKKAVLSKPGLP